MAQCLVTGPMPSKRAMDRYPPKKDGDGGYLESNREMRREAFDTGALDALSYVAESFRGRVIWPGDLEKIADEWRSK